VCQKLQHSRFFTLNSFNDSCVSRIIHHSKNIQPVVKNRPVIEKQASDRKQASGQKQASGRKQVMGMKEDKVLFHQ
jgi:hypothetical protein